MVSLAAATCTRTTHACEPSPAWLPLGRGALCAGPCAEPERGGAARAQGQAGEGAPCPHPLPSSGKPAPPGGRARLSPRPTLGSARLSPAARLGSALGSGPRPLRRGHFSAAPWPRARPARAHAGHQVRGGRRRVSARGARDGAGAARRPAWRGSRLEGAAGQRARWGGVPAPGEASSQAHLMLQDPDLAAAAGPSMGGGVGGPHLGCTLSRPLPPAPTAQPPKPASQILLPQP